MYTSFGKFLKKLRIDHNELQKDMAEKIGITGSYLSLIELGKRNIPKDAVSKIIKHYNLTDNQKLELKKLYLLHNLSKRELKILQAVVNVLYLEDNSDYIRVLGDILRSLLGDEIIDNDNFSLKEWNDALSDIEIEELKKDE